MIVEFDNVGVCRRCDVDDDGNRKGAKKVTVPGNCTRAEVSQSMNQTLRVDVCSIILMCAMKLCGENVVRNAILKFLLRRYVIIIQQEFQKSH
jgi:hypothetical protein